MRVALESEVPLRARGRPRREGTGARIRAAAGAELVENGVAGFSITKVAKRAGVAKGTVSLRYPEPLDLMVDAISELFAWEPVPDLGDFARELRMLSQRLVDAAFHPPMFGLSQSVLASASERPEVWTHYVDRIVGTGLALSREVFDRAVARGEIPSSLDVDALVVALVGGLQMTTESDKTMDPPSAVKQDALVGVILAACGVPAGKGRAVSGRGTKAAASPGRRAAPPAHRRRG